jgi:tyrosyl-tRNA synthetase
MLMGLKEGQEKMSKSEPDTAIFMEDTVEDVKRKVKRAFCPPTVAGNPILDWVKHIIFGKHPSWTLKRSAENGGDVTFDSFDALATAYEAGGVHPGDLKENAVNTLNALLQPVRDHFASGEPKALLEKVKSYRVSR